MIFWKLSKDANIHQKIVTFLTMRELIYWQVLKHAKMYVEHQMYIQNIMGLKLIGGVGQCTDNGQKCIATNCGFIVTNSSIGHFLELPLNQALLNTFLVLDSLWILKLRLVTHIMYENYLMFTLFRNNLKLLSTTYW